MCEALGSKHFVSVFIFEQDLLTVWLTLLFSRLQLQNSRMVIQERDRVIRELEEKVAFLEAEVNTAYCLLLLKIFYGFPVEFRNYFECIIY